MTVSTATMAIEEPPYRVARTIDDAEGTIEIRDYAPYTVAEVEVAGAAVDAGGQAFPILFGYISGRNVDERQLSMTAPVVQTAASAAMPAPVIQSSAPPSSADGTVVQFVLPKEVTRVTAPVPRDPRVRIRDVPARRYAVIRFSGFWSDANYRDNLARLAAVVETAGLHVVGEPSFSRYDAPFKPWFMRRNEIWLPVAG